VRHLHELVDAVEPRRGRNDILAEALDLVRARVLGVVLARLLVLLEDRAFRVDADDLHVRVLLLQELAGARYRSARSTGDEVVRDLAFGVAPDLGARSAVVRL